MVSFTESQLIHHTEAEHSHKKVADLQMSSMWNDPGNQTNQGNSLMQIYCKGNDNFLTKTMQNSKSAKTKSKSVDQELELNC